MSLIISLILFVFASNFTIHVKIIQILEKNEPPERMRLGQCHSFSSQEFLRHEYYDKKMCVKKLFGVVKVTHAIEASGHMFYLMRFLASKMYEDNVD